MSELLDVVNIYGDPTGIVLDKQTIHAEGLLHGDVHVWLTNGRDLLQQQRRSDKDIMPDEWDGSASGHVGVGESFLEAAIRETKEELGLEFAAHRFKRLGFLPTAMLFPGWKHPHRVINDNFVVYEPDLQLSDVRFQAAEVQAVRLYNIDLMERDLLNPMTAGRHAPHPTAQYTMAIAGMRAIAAAA